MSYVAVEGCIGSGKTSLAKAIAVMQGWRLLEEPVEGNDLLPAFYADPKRWAFTLQVALLHSRYRAQQVAAHDQQVCVLDRSLAGDFCFGRLHERSGNMHPLEWKTYQACYEAMNAVRPPFVMLFLSVDPVVALARVKKRARGMEVGVSLQYLTDLCEEYERLLTDIESGQHHWSRGIRVKRLDWNDDRDPVAAAKELAPMLRREMVQR